MGRSIIDLDHALRPASARTSKDSARRPQLHRRPDQGPALPTERLTLRRKKRPAITRLPRQVGARAFGLVEARMAGVLDPLQQASSRSCWATVYTMLYSWKIQQSTTVETAVAQVGPRWSALLAKSQTRGMLGPEKVDFIADAGLIAEPPMNPTIQRWADLVANYGPIWVTTDEDPNSTFSIHARVLCAVYGDGTPDGTKLEFVDPLTGKLVVESFNDFLVKFESEAATPGRPLRVQIVHWPAGAQTFALTRRRTASASSVQAPLFAGTARAALLATLIDRGVPKSDANSLIESFAAEVRAEHRSPMPMSYRPARAFGVPEVPRPESGDPHETAAEILQYFYQGRSFASITDDHVRLAAAMFYAALAKQKCLNMLPDNPGFKPGVSWLAKQAIKKVWSHMRGPSGFTTAVRNAVAIQWRTTLEEIENGLEPTALGVAFSLPSKSVFIQELVREGDRWRMSISEVKSAEELQREMFPPGSNPAIRVTIQEEMIQHEPHVIGHFFISGITEEAVHAMEDGFAEAFRRAGFKDGAAEGKVRTWMKGSQEPWDISEDEATALYVDNFVSARLPNLSEMTIYQPLADQIIEFQYANGKTFSVRLGDIDTGRLPQIPDRLWNDSNALIIPVDDSWQPVLNGMTALNMVNFVQNLQIEDAQIRAQQLEIGFMILTFAKAVQRLARGSRISNPVDAYRAAGRTWR